eukprot:PhM_4_TR4517/c0_g1_i1/m.58667
MTPSSSCISWARCWASRWRCSSSCCCCCSLRAAHFSLSAFMRSSIASCCGVVCTPAPRVWAGGLRSPARILPGEKRVLRAPAADDTRVLLFDEASWEDEPGGAVPAWMFCALNSMFTTARKHCATSPRALSERFAVTLSFSSDSFRLGRDDRRSSSLRGEWGGSASPMAVKNSAQASLSVGSVLDCSPPNSISPSDWRAPCRAPTACETLRTAPSRNTTRLGSSEIVSTMVATASCRLLARRDARAVSVGDGLLTASAAGTAKLASLGRGVVEKAAKTYSVCVSTVAVSTRAGRGSAIVCCGAFPTASDASDSPRCSSSMEGVVASSFPTCGRSSFVGVVATLSSGSTATASTPPTCPLSDLRGSACSPSSSGAPEAATKPFFFDPCFDFAPAVIFVLALVAFFCEVGVVADPLRFLLDPPPPIEAALVTIIVGAGLSGSTCTPIWLVAGFGRSMYCITTLGSGAGATTSATARLSFLSVADDDDPFSGVSTTTASDLRRGVETGVGAGQ